jgi:hypothetical protein
MLATLQQSRLTRKAHGFLGYLLRSAQPEDLDMPVVIGKPWIWERVRGHNQKDAPASVRRLHDVGERFVLD